MTSFSLITFFKAKTPNKEIFLLSEEESLLKLEMDESPSELADQLVCS